jgi:hypothetical protein
MRGIFIGGLLALGAGASLLRRKFYEEGPVNCEICEKKFVFLKRSRYSCDSCDKTICSDCSQAFVKKIQLCNPCNERVENEVEKILVVRSSRADGYRTAQTLGRIQSRHSHRKRKLAEKDLLYQCTKAGGNAILNFDTERDSEWISSNHQFGIPGFTMQSSTSVFTAEGTAAILEKGTSSSTQESGSIKTVADELEKLAALKKKGILTDEEFLEQKRKILNQG